MIRAKHRLALSGTPRSGLCIDFNSANDHLFVVGTEADHVAPWTSVYKVDNLVRSDDLTFLLTAGGTAFAVNDTFVIVTTARTYADVDGGAFTGLTTLASIQKKAMQIGQDAEHRFAGAFFKPTQARLEERDVAPETIDDKTFDAVFF